MLRNPAQLAQNIHQLHRMKAEVLAPAPHRLRNILRLRRRHHEDDVIRRLLQRLQQRIERRIRNLVRLIQNVNLVLVSRRPIPRRIPQLAYLVDPAIGRRVDLDHIHRIARANLRAALAHQAWLRRRPDLAPNRIPAVQRTRQNARDRRLPNPPVPAEDIPMRNPVLRQRIHQRDRHMVLPRNIRKPLWPILPGQYLITHKSDALISILPPQPAPSRRQNTEPLWLTAPGRTAQTYPSAARPPSPPHHRLRLALAHRPTQRQVVRTPRSRLKHLRIQPRMRLADRPPPESKPGPDA